MMEYIVGGWRVWFTVLSQYNLSSHSGRLCSVAQFVDEQDCDGVVLTSTDPPLGIYTADCLPLVITTSDRAALLHVSRKTLLTSLLPTALQALEGAEVTGVLFGPHICAQHLVYEYTGEEIVAFKKAFPQACQATTSGQSLSLKIACEETLMHHVPSTTPIIIDGRCTYEDASLPSYRRWLEGGKSGELPHLFTRASRA